MWDKVRIAATKAARAIIRSRVLWVLFAILGVLALSTGVAVSIATGVAFAGPQWPFDLGGLAGGFVAVLAAWLAVRWEAASVIERQRTADQAAVRSALENVRTMIGVSFVKVTPLFNSLMEVLTDLPWPPKRLKLKSTINAMKRGWLVQASEPVPYAYVAALPAPYPYFFTDRFRAFAHSLEAIVDPPDMELIAQADDETEDLEIFSHAVALEQALTALQDMLNTTDALASKLTNPPDDLARDQRQQLADALRALAQYTAP